jgi:hypothetical protein
LCRLSDHLCHCNGERAHCPTPRDQYHGYYPHGHLLAFLGANPQETGDTSGQEETQIYPRPREGGGRYHHLKNTMLDYMHVYKYHNETLLYNKIMLVYVYIYVYIYKFYLFLLQKTILENSGKKKSLAREGEEVQGARTTMLGRV